MSTVVSPGVVLTSMIVFTLVYGALAAVWFTLMRRYAIEGVPLTVRDESPEAQEPPDEDSESADRPLSFAY